MQQVYYFFMVSFFEASYNDGFSLLLGFLDRFGLF